MNSVHELIRQKLAATISREKKRIASSLLEATTSKTEKPVGIKAGKGRPAGQPVISPAVAKGHRRQALKISIQDKAQKVVDQQRKLGKSRDQQHAHNKLNIARLKLGLDRLKYRAIK